MGSVFIVLMLFLLHKYFCYFGSVAPSSFPTDSGRLSQS